MQDPKYKSAYRILQQLCDVVSKNGNLLLNVGPCADGTFPEEAKKELYKVGDWLKKYGEAIYGTVPFDVAHEGVTKATNFLILGNNDYCPTIKDGKSSKHKKAEAAKLKGQDIEIMPESVFYDMIAEYVSESEA